MNVATPPALGASALNAVPQVGPVAGIPWGRLVRLARAFAARSPKRPRFRDALAAFCDLARACPDALDGWERRLDGSDGKAEPAPAPVPVAPAPVNADGGDGAALWADYAGL